jgi:hypothetical protein
MDQPLSEDHLFFDPDSGSDFCDTVILDENKAEFDCTTCAVLFSVHPLKVHLPNTYCLSVRNPRPNSVQDPFPLRTHFRLGPNSVPDQDPIPLRTQSRLGPNSA